jgi:hypothetical protein
LHERSLELARIALDSFERMNTPEGDTYRSEMLEWLATRDELRD